MDGNDGRSYVLHHHHQQQHQGSSGSEYEDHDRWQQQQQQHTLSATKLRRHYLSQQQQRRQILPTAYAYNNNNNNGAVLAPSPHGRGYGEEAVPAYATTAAAEGERNPYGAYADVDEEDSAATIERGGGYEGEDYDDDDDDGYATSASGRTSYSEPSFRAVAAARGTARRYDSYQGQHQRRSSSTSLPPSPMLLPSSSTANDGIIRSRASIARM
jgi:RimJ/RimL family protein N-acetyltransferase